MAEAARQNLLNNQQAKEARMKNLMETNTLTSVSKTEKMKKEQEIQMHNKAVSELKTIQKKERQELNWAEKLQELPVAGISNTINNIKIKDVGEDEFE